MIDSSIKIFGQLTRLDTCVIAFLSLAIPLYYSTGDLSASVIHSLPILTISMCGFVINDLHDIDKDVQNHPSRPLPSNKLSPVTASLIYFLLLAISLILVKAYVAASHVYLYLLLLIGLINYNYIVLYLPACKNLCVAAVGIMPIVILASLLPPRQTYWPVIVSLFLLLLAREMLMDIEDAAGDGETLVKRIGLVKSQYIAFGAKAAGVLVISSQATERWGIVILLVFIVSDLMSFYLWKYTGFRARILLGMKLQLVLGIYFLV